MSRSGYEIWLPPEELETHPRYPRLVTVDELDVDLCNLYELSGGYPDRLPAILVREIRPDRHQIIDGHRRARCAATVGLPEVRCRVVEMADDEAFRQLVVANRHAALTALDHGLHALYAVPEGQESSGGRGRESAITQYSRSVGMDPANVSRNRRAAIVVCEALDENPGIDTTVLADQSRQLDDIGRHAVRGPDWPRLVSYLSGRLLQGTKVSPSEIRECAMASASIRRMIAESKLGTADEAELSRRLDSLLEAAATDSLAVEEAKPLRGQLQSTLWQVRGEIRERHRRELPPKHPGENTAPPVSDSRSSGPGKDESGDNEEPGELSSSTDSGGSKAGSRTVQILPPTELSREMLLRDGLVCDSGQWQYGDFWELAANAIEPGTVDLLLTDPPYGQSTRNSRSGCIVNDANPKQAIKTLDAYLKRFAPLMAADCRLLIWCPFRLEPITRGKIAKAGYTLRGRLVWVKGAPGKEHFGSGNTDLDPAPAAEYVLHAVRGSPPSFYPRVREARYADNPSGYPSKLHPTPKPEGLLEEWIAAATRPGQLVADPFGGTGSTCAAAIRAGRRFFGCEIDPETYLNAAWHLAEVLRETDKKAA